MIKHHLVLIISLVFFLALLAIGLSIYKDFGVPTDESAQLQIAVWNHRYIFKGDPTLLSFKDRYYGAIFELPLFELYTRFVGPESIYVRHLALFLIFLVSLIIFYLLGRRLFHNPWWGLLAAGMLVATPRIFADAFYNSKDIPFMDMFIVAVWTLVLLIDSLKEKSSQTKIHIMVGLHALASAVLVDTRVAGIVIIPISLVLLLAIEWTLVKSWKHTVVDILLYLVFFAGLTILFWPVLWHDPIGGFLNAFQQMSKYDVYGKAVLFMGKYVPTESLPWQYLPVWIGISTPLVILAGIIIGFAEGIRSLTVSIRKGLNSWIQSIARLLTDPDKLAWLAVLGWLVIPIAAVYWFHSVLYNGWRQMFFIYPALVLISVYGFFSLRGWLVRNSRHWVAGTLVTLFVLAVGLAEPIGFIVRYHPYEYIYFNQLAGDPATIRYRFELDYWCLSYKQAIDYILAHDPRQAIPITVADSPGLDYIYSALLPAQRSRLVILANQDNGADYFIGDYLFHPKDYYPSRREYFSVFVRGIKIIVVYRLR
jgi:hypothetical protein